MLTSADILLILDRIGREIVVPATERFPYDVVTRRAHGYSDDATIGALQAKLSIMLELAGRREGR